MTSIGCVLSTISSEILHNSYKFFNSYILIIWWSFFNLWRDIFVIFALLFNAFNLYLYKLIIIFSTHLHVENCKFFILLIGCCVITIFVLLFFFFIDNVIIIFAILKSIIHFYGHISQLTKPLHIEFSIWLVYLYESIL